MAKPGRETPQESGNRMNSSFLLHHLLLHASEANATAPALISESKILTYGELAVAVRKLTQSLGEIKTEKHQRIAIFLDKRFEFVVTCFAASASAQIFVPINPILKPLQVHHILVDSQARILVTTLSRLLKLRQQILDGKELALQFVIYLEDEDSLDLEPRDLEGLMRLKQDLTKIRFIPWSTFISKAAESSYPDSMSEIQDQCIDQDPVSIFYTSGSTGLPKGVLLSHRNMVSGAKSVNVYLENSSSDVLLAALPFSFDAGFSQLTTAFHARASVVLLNYMMPKDILLAVIKNRVTGLTAVPPLWMQIIELSWPSSVSEHFRYFANTGGRMPRSVLDRLRQHFPAAKPFLMYGLTEAFRSTFLPPSEIDRRPDSIGQAIPNVEILVLRPDGTSCAPDEPGELVHRGALVGLGYWGDSEKTSEKYRPLPAQAQATVCGAVLPELVVYSGDIVRRDKDGFLYFIGRRDEMIKTSGYRVSPTEIEEAVFSSGLVKEAAAFGIANEELGQEIVITVVALDGPATQMDEEIIQSQLQKHLREILPTFQQPKKIVFRKLSLPRNPNGKIDRKRLALEFEELQKLSKEKLNKE